MTRSTMQRTRRRSRRTGFTLYEMLIVFSTLAIVGLVGARLTKLTLDAIGESAAASARSAALEAMVRTLRADVWASRGVAERRAGTVELDTPDGPIVWTLDADRAVRQGTLPGSNAPIRSSWSIGAGTATLAVAGDARSVELRGGDVTLPLTGPMLSARNAGNR